MRLKIKHTAFFLLAGFTAPLFAQDGPKPAELCSISGQVVRADIGEPLKSARISLLEGISGEKRHTYRAFSDGRGHFSISGIAPGRYRFSASHNGFVAQSFKPKGATAEGALLQLSAGQKLEKLLFRLTPAAVITGKITDEDGQPLSGVEMEALIKASQAQIESDDSEDEAAASEMFSKLEMVPAGMAVTNDLGEYRIYGLPPGDYYVAAIDSGMPEMTEPALRGGSIGWEYGNGPETDHPPMYYPGVFARNEAEKLHVGAGGTLRIDLTLRSAKTHKVSGRVLEANGQPAAGVYVTLVAQDMDVAFTALRNTETTDAQGRFTVKGVIPGSYVLQAHHNQDGTQLSAAIPVEIAGQEPSEVTLKLERNISVSGRVLPPEATGVPQIDLSALHLWLSPVDDKSIFSHFGAAGVKKDGTFTVIDVHKGTYSVLLSGLPSGWYLKSASLGTTDALTHGVDVGGASGSLDLTLSSKAAGLAGTVTMDDKPVPGAVVEILPEHDNRFRRDLRRKAVTDQNGRFVFESLVPARYRVQATVPSDEEEAAGLRAKAAQTLELAESDKQTITLELTQRDR